MSKIKKTFSEIIILCLILLICLAPLETTFAASNISTTKSVSLAVSKKIALKSIFLNKTSTTINVGKTEVLKVSYRPSNATVTKKTTWKSSNTSVATVNNNGKVTAKKAGTSIITATCNGKKATCKVTVKSIPLKSIKFIRSYKDISLFRGKTYQLRTAFTPANATNVKLTWSSSNTKIATVNNTGLITAKYPGKAKITVSCGKIKTSINVIVKNRITAISLNYNSIDLDKGKSVSLKATYSPNDVKETVTWKSSNTSVATVNSNGVVTAKKSGSTQITATVCGMSKKCLVVVHQPVTVITPTNGQWQQTSTAYKLLNYYRTQSGLNEVAKDAYLEKYAKIRAIEIITKFDHVRPNGTRGISIIPGNIYKGENIAEGFSSGVSVTKAWYASDGHKSNMLKKQYNKVGIACIKYEGNYYWVQMFSS